MKKRNLLLVVCIITVGLSGLTANAASREADFEEYDNYDCYKQDEQGEAYFPLAEGEFEENDNDSYHELDVNLEESYLPPKEGGFEERDNYGYHEIDEDSEETYLPSVGCVEESRPSPSFISDIDVGMGVTVTICTDGNTGELSILFVNQSSPKERGEDCGIPTVIAQNGAIVGIKDGQVILIQPAPLPGNNWGVDEEIPPITNIITDDTDENLEVHTPNEVDISAESTSVKFVPRKERVLFKGTHSYAELWKVTDENVGGLNENFAGLLSKAEKDIVFDGTVTLSYLQSLNPKADTVYQGYIRLNGQDG
ncbi:MAG: hypothetical protein HFJ27_00455, partial [Clostridia bacterium]|nr:hypothetical protein [Clostridia bacterium]